MWNPNWAVNSNPGSTRIGPASAETRPAAPLHWVAAGRVFEQLQILDLAPEVGVAPHRVVIGQRDDVETAFFSAVQEIENADSRLLVVGGGRGVDMKVDAAPHQVLRGGWLRNTGGFWGPARPLTRRCCDREPGDDAVGALSRRLRGGGIELLLPERERRSTANSEAARCCPISLMIACVQLLLTIRHDGGAP